MTKHRWPTEKTDLSAVDLGSFTPFRSFDLKDLGFILDNGLKLNKQINSVVSSSFYHLRSLAKVKPFLSRKFWDSCFYVITAWLLQFTVSRPACHLLIDFNWSKTQQPTCSRVVANRTTSCLFYVLCTGYLFIMAPNTKSCCLYAKFKQSRSSIPFRVDYRTQSWQITEITD